MTRGVLIRAFESNPDNIEKRVEKVNELVEKLVGVVDEIIILIPEDKHKFDLHGKLVDKIRDKATVKIVKGNQFTDVLNYGISQLDEKEIKTGYIISPEVSHLVTNAILLQLDENIQKDKIGFSAVTIKDERFGPQLEKSGREGFLLNTFGAWDIEALMKVGGFGPEGELGVEEIGATIRLINEGYGLAPIQTNTSNYDYMEGTEKHQNQKFSTKLLRQVNSYITLLKNKGEITEDTYEQIYRKLGVDNTYEDAKDEELRKKFEKQLKQILKKAVIKN